jgi:hypothetical protein
MVQEFTAEWLPVHCVTNRLAKAISQDCWACAARILLCRMCQTCDWGICNSWLVWCADFWELLTKVSCTHLTVSADSPGLPVCFTAHRQPLCWNFFYHSQTVGGSLWCLDQNLHYTVTIDSVLANSNTQNTFLSPVLAMFCHDCLLAVIPASMPWCLLPKQTWRDSPPIDMLPSPVSVLVVALPGSEGTYELPCIHTYYRVYTKACIFLGGTRDLQG